MTDGEATVGVEAAAERIDDGRVGTLAGTRLDRIAVGIVVLSLFFERLDRSLYSSGRSAIPDLTFDAAVLVLSLRYLHELARGRLRLGRVTAREYVAAGFVILVFVLGVASWATVPHWISSGTQVAKSSIHLAFLAYTAILIGRTVSRELLQFALKLYFWIASGAAALAIVQAVDLNAGNGLLTRHLHLVYRWHPPHYEAPCSIFSEPAQLGYASVAALVVGVLLWRSIGLRRALVGGTLCVLAVLLSLSAGALFVAGVLAIVLAFGLRPRLSRRAWVGVSALAVVVVAVGLASPAGSALYRRASGIVTGHNGTAQYRLSLDRASIRIWRIAPATGVGIGNTRELLPFVYKTANRKFNDANGYLSLFEETGVAGLAAAVVLVAAFIWPVTRPARLPTAPQLNTLGVAASFLVAGSFLLPPLWFWGGLRMVEARAGAGSDLFRGAVSTVRGSLRPRTIFGQQITKSRLRLVIALLVLGIAAVSGYAFRAQETSSRSVRLVRVAGTGELTTAPVPGDPARAHADLQLWAARHCRKHCHESLHYVGGRLWRIEARWPNGSECLLLDLARFGTSAAASPHSVTRGFTGLTRISCG